jgi:hypothetical protein
MRPDFPDKPWALIGDVNAADHAGQSALYRVTRSRNASEVETLLFSGSQHEFAERGWRNSVVPSCEMFC